MSLLLALDQFRISHLKLAALAREIDIRRLEFAAFIGERGIGHLKLAALAREIDIRHPEFAAFIGELGIGYLELAALSREIEISRPEFAALIHKLDIGYTQFVAIIRKLDIPFRSAADLAQEIQSEHGEQESGNGGQGQDYLGVRPPHCQSFVVAQPHGYEQRISRDAPIAIETRYVIEFALPDIGTLDTFRDESRTIVVCDGLANAVQPFRAILAEAGKNDIVGTDQPDGAVLAEVDGFEERRHFGRGEQENQHADEAPVAGLDALGNRNQYLIVGSAVDRRSDVQALELSVELDAEMLEVAYVYGLKVGNLRVGYKHAVRRDNAGLDDGTRLNRDLARPCVNIHIRPLGTHAMSDGVHDCGNRVERMRHLIVEGEVYVGGVGPHILKR